MTDFGDSRLGHRLEDRNGGGKAGFLGVLSGIKNSARLGLMLLKFLILEQEVLHSHFAPASANLRAGPR